MKPNKEHNRIITELSRCEAEMDAVLFDRAGDIATGAAGAAGVGAAGLGGAYLYGRKKLSGISKKPGWELLPSMRRGLRGGLRDGPPALGIGGTIETGIKAAGTDLKAAGGDLWKNLLKWSKKGAGAIGKLA